MNVSWGDNYIDATNTFIGGGGGDTIINGQPLENYIYVMSNTNLYIHNPNSNGIINLTTYTNPNNVKIDIDGRLKVYHDYDILLPTIPSGWYDVKNEIVGGKFNDQGNSIAILALGADIALINTQLETIEFQFTVVDNRLLGLELLTSAHTDLLSSTMTTETYEQLVNTVETLEDWRDVFGGINKDEKSFYQRIIGIADNIYGTIGGIGFGAGVIGTIYSLVEGQKSYNLASNVSNVNFEIPNNEREYMLQSNVSNQIIYAENLLSSFSNFNIHSGFINSNIITTQFVPSLKSNKVLLGNITTPNSSYQMEMTGDLNANEYYRNSTSLTSLLAQKQDNMSATQPIYITTSTIGLNYDSSLTKVGNNLSVVKTASAPLRWSGNNLILDYDSTLLNNSGSLGVTIAAESKWVFTGANIYNKAKTNVGIGTDSGLIYKLNVVGDSYFSSNVNIATSKLNFISSYTTATLTQVTGGTEYYLQYTANGTLVLNEPCACDLLIVGAGGNGGTGASSGGGGAGEVIYYQNFPLRSGTLNITVGTSSSTAANRISKINHSSGDQIKALGGGNGGLPDNLFTANGSITITINAIALYNYTETVNLSPGTYTITFASGAITLTGIAADKSYPLLKNGSGVTINPLAWYKLDGSTSDLIIDSSGNNYTLTNTGVTFDNTNYIKGNGSSSYIGTTNYLSVPTTIDFNAINTANGITFSCWIKINSSTPSYACIFHFGTVNDAGNDDCRIVGFNRFTANDLRFFIVTSPTDGNPAGKNGYAQILNDVNYADGTWRFVTWTISSTGYVNIYINGVNKYAAQWMVIPQFTVNKRNRIGSLIQSNTSINGNIDDFRIYPLELSSSQVSELYKGRVLIYANPASGGSGGGGAKSQIGAVAGVKFDDYKSLALAGLNGTSTNGGNGGTGNSTYGTRFTTTITGSSLSVGLGGSGVGVSPATPAAKTNYGDGGDGNGGTGYQGIVIIRFKEASSHLQLKAIKDNANTGLIVNANESPNSYQLRVYPWSDTYQLTGIATRGWSMRVHDGNNNLDLLNLFSSFGGRIGVKTKNPTATLDVNGDITCKTFNIIGNELYGITCQVVNQHDTGEASINVSAGASGNYGAMSVVYLPSENLGYISCSKSLQIKTQSVGSYIHIDNTTGYVGIGNNLPQAKLHVGGTILASSISVTTLNSDSVATGNISCTSLDLNNGSIIDCNRLNSVDVWTGPIKATSLDLDGGNITNGGFFYGMAQQARFLNMSTGEWHYDTQSRNRFYFTNDGTNSHTVFRTGSTTHYFQDKDATDYCLLDRFGISTYFEVISGGGYDNLGVLDASATGVYVYRKMLVRLSTFTEVHRCFIEDDLYLNYDDFINVFVGRVVVSKGKIKTALKEVDKQWEIFEGKDGITIDDSHPVVELSRKKKDKAVVGVITKRNQNNDLPGRLVINSLGETAIWVVNTNGNIETGDLITTSDELGYGERQDDDIIRNYTIGKCMISCDFELDNPNYKCEVIDEARDLRRAFLPIFIYSG